MEAWTTLVHAFDAQTHARATQLRGQLTKMEKGAMSASAFFNQVKAVADTLTSIGQPLRDEEFAAYVLDGLDSDYDNLAENIAGRETPIAPGDLYTRILHTEQRLSARRGNHAFPDPSANAAFRGGRGGGGGGGRGGGGGGQPQQPSRQPNPNPNPPPNFNYGGGNGGGGRRSRPVCQLCDTVGHITSRCYKRFDRDFLGVGNDGTSTARQVAMATHGHGGSAHGHGGPPHGQGVQQGATTSYNIDPPWYFDTGATDHLTGELDKLAMKEPYKGKDQVHTANGAGMRISHIGQSSISTSGSRPLHLRNVLCVPEVSRSLLSVKRLTRDNNVFVEFHPSDVFVNDRDSRAIILSGRSRGSDLYPVGVSPVREVFSSVRVSSAKWHCRLGHPASPIVQHVLRQHELPIESSNKTILVCDACQQGKSHQLPFLSSTHVIKTPLELIYSDVWGPAQTSVSGHTYYVSFIDAYSRFTWFYLLKRKSDVFDVFLKFQTHVELVCLVTKFSMSSQIARANIATSTPSLRTLVLFIVSPVLILINKTVLRNASIVILLKPGSHYLLIPQFRFTFGVMHLLLRVFLLTGFLLVSLICILPLRNS